jgi:signal transduction histidine kinase
VGIGLVLNVLLGSGQLPNPVVFLKTDAGTWALAGGAVLSALLAIRPAWLDSQDRLRQRYTLEGVQSRHRFLFRLDHELKNPLTALRAGLANLAETASTDSQRQTITSLEAQTLRLSRLTADLSKLAELESSPLEPARVELAELMKDALALAREHPSARGRRLTLTLPQAPWPLASVLGDRDLLFLALYNLLDNALKFTRQGDTIELRAAEDGSGVVIEVADTGPGIPSTEVPHVWDELYRGEGARGTPGSGLGLPLVRAIAEKHGGHVALRTRPGEGTVVSLRLPGS